MRSIAHCLNDAGYRCGYIGKWHMDGADRGGFIPPGPRRQGFDDFWAVNNCNHQYLNAYYYLNDDPQPVWIDGYEPAGQTLLAAQYIQDKAAADTPFCLLLSWGPPHCPYRQLPQTSLDLYPPESIDLMPTAVDSQFGDGALPAAEQERHKREAVAGYYAHITAMDECFGRLMQALDECGAADNTIVVFSSDHGDMLFNHNRGWKCKPWRESVGIPLIVRWPGRVPAGRVTDGPIGIVDHMPTLLSLAGVDVPGQVEGCDLASFVLGDDSAAPESAFINHLVALPNWSHREWRGVVTRTHTYARFRDRPWILYDDKADPQQTHNVADSPEHAALRSQMEAKVQDWLGRTHDPFETSLQVADKYLPGHVNGVVPYYENDTIRRGRRRNS